MPEVRSENVESVEHNGRQLVVKYRSGATYFYDLVPRPLYQRMLREHQNGGSVTAFLRQHIWDRFQQKRQGRD